MAENDWLVWLGVGVAAVIAIVGAAFLFAPQGQAESGLAVQSVYEERGESLSNSETISFTDRRGRRRTIQIDREVHG